MKAKITSQLLVGLPTRNSPYEINDTELRGFQLRVQPSGTKTYLCVYRLRNSGRKNRYVIGRSPPLSPTQARDEAKKILGDVARGIDPNEARRQRRKEAREPTLQQFIDQHYASWVDAHLGTAEKTLARIRAAFAEFLDVRLGSLNAWQLDKWKSRRLKSGLKATTVNRDLAVLRSTLTKAVEWDFIAEHPMRKVKQVKSEEDYRVRFLSDTEETQVRAALDRRDQQARLARQRHNHWRIERGRPPVHLFGEHEFVDHIRPMILLSMNTGVRRGELFKLRHSDIDLVGRQLKVRAAAAKSGKSRFIPLNDEAFNMLERWTRQHPGTPDALVFPGKDGGPMTNIDSAWGSIVRAAGLRDFRWHDLRHHFASRLAMAGVDLNTVRELLGHADLKMTLRYAHLAPQHKALAVAKLMRAA